jgi:hypothetical protein
VATFSSYITAAFPGVTATNIVGMTAEPENDGVPNLLKFFMGISPTASVASPLTYTLDGLGDIVLYFRMANGLTGVSYSIDESSDLKTWTSTGLQGTVMSNMGSYSNMKVVIPMEGLKDELLRLSVSSP